MLRSLLYYKVFLSSLLLLEEGKRRLGREVVAHGGYFDFSHFSSKIMREIDFITIHICAIN